MNHATDARLKIMKGQKHFPASLVMGLLEENDQLRKVNAHLRDRVVSVSIIGGQAIATENGVEVCEPVPVVTVKS